MAIVGNNGLEFANTFTHYVGSAYGLSGFKYGQGGSHMFRSFTVGADGRATTYGQEHEIPGGFNTVNEVGRYAATI